MEIILCATQSHLATAWRDRIGSRLAATVRVVEGTSSPLAWLLSSARQTALASWMAALTPFIRAFSALSSSSDSRA